MYESANLTSALLLIAALAGLLTAIVRFKAHPFLALLLTALFFGWAMGLPSDQVIEVVLTGFADTLKWIGIVMVLGTLIGEILNETGGSQRIADSILGWIGEKRVPVAMAVTGYVVSIPVFVDVAYITLVPIAEALAVKSKRNILGVGLALAAGLTATHALLPPTPGPLAVTAILEADLGRVIWINSFVALLAAAGGLFWVIVYSGKIELPSDRNLRSRLGHEEGDLKERVPLPSNFASFAPILVPLVLIAAGSFVSTGDESWFGSVVRLLGAPVIALLAGSGLATLLLRCRKQVGKVQVLLNRAIEKSAVVIMITSAGGAFGAIIKASDVAPAVSTALESLGLPGLFFPFFLALGLTTATGSLTVSMVTSASIVAPMLSGLKLSPETAVALIGAGSVCVTHANASFFWLLTRLHGVPPNVLYRTYSVQSLFMGLGGFLAVVLLHISGIAN